MTTKVYLIHENMAAGLISKSCWVYLKTIFNWLKQIESGVAPALLK